MTDADTEAAVNGDAASAPPEDWVAVVTERLGREIGPVRRLSRVTRGRMLSALSRSARDVDDHLDPDLAPLLELIGLDSDRHGPSVREFAAIVDLSEGAGLQRGAMPQILQAYVRAISRIVSVESAIGIDVLRRVEPERRTAVAADLIDELLPTSVRGFDLLHRAMLRDALLEAADGVTADDAEVENLAVGMVDLVASTSYFSVAGTAELERVVDALFTAGQAATAGRAAHVVKHVGDGMLIAANDVATVADAALDIVARLERELPLRARGGISHGEVVQRAGDLFGLSVNLAQALTKAARPGTILMSADAAALIPSSRTGRVRRRKLPNPALGEQSVATLRQA